MLTKELLKQLESYIKTHWRDEHICACIDIEALEERLRQIKETFPQYLLNFIAERGLNEVDVYKKAQLDRRIFSKLRNEKGYMPSKNTLIAIAFGMELTLDEAEDLLKRAGYSLSDYNKGDVIIKFCFENKIHDLFEVNEALDHCGYMPLGYRNFWVPKKFLDLSL